MANPKIADITIFFFDKITMSIHCILKTKLSCWNCIKKSIIGLRTCMVIEYCFLFLNLYIACSYQPKIQKWVLISWVSSFNRNRITTLVSTPMFSGLMIRMGKPHTGTLLWRIWIKFKMATDEIFFDIVLKTSTWLENPCSCIWTCICYSLTNLS